MSTPALIKVSNGSQPVDLASCSEIQYEVKDGIHGVAYSLNDGESGWTPVVGKKKKRRVPDYIRRRFLLDHPIHNSPESEDLSTVIPTGANVDVYFDMVDNTPS